MLGKGSTEEFVNEVYCAVLQIEQAWKLVQERIKGHVKGRCASAAAAKAISNHLSSMRGKQGPIDGLHDRILRALVKNGVKDLVSKGMGCGR